MRFMGNGIGEAIEFLFRLCGCMAGIGVVGFVVACLSLLFR